MNIEVELEKWDGKSSADIRMIHDQHLNDPEYMPHLVSLIASSQVGTGATWLLKKALKAGTKISPDNIDAIYKGLSELNHWEQKLHLLQCIEYLSITDLQKHVVETFLRECLVDKNKFVRAWGYSGFYYLSNQYDEYRKEATQLIETALKDEAPSVKARLRKISNNVS